jgi:hypothetical protein
VKCTPDDDEEEEDLTKRRSAAGKLQDAAEVAVLAQQQSKAAQLVDLAKPAPVSARASGLQRVDAAFTDAGIHLVPNNANVID